MSRRTFAAALVASTAVTLATAPAVAASSATAKVAAKQFFWPVGGGPTAARAAAAGPDASNNLIFHGGAVEHRPAVYLVFWGTEWQHGFTTSDGTVSYTGAAAKRYIQAFFAGVGGSHYNGLQTQYCDNIAAGATSCSGQDTARFVTNPAQVLQGVWVDPTAVPATIVTSGLAENLTQDPLAQEAVRAEKHFGYDIDATYFVLTPPGHTATAYGSVYCAYHTEVTNIGGHGIRYAFVPYVMEQGAGCGQYSVNKTPDSFGHGFFDGYSIVAGHEYAEAVTDPDAYPFQDGWNDASTSENGDKCAWFDLRDIGLAGKRFAVQPLWSNEANGGSGGCAYARGTGPAPVPPPA